MSKSNYPAPLKKNLGIIERKLFTSHSVQMKPTLSAPQARHTISAISKSLSSESTIKTLTLKLT